MKFEVLLHDLTSTYFESDPPFPDCRFSLGAIGELLFKRAVTRRSDSIGGQTPRRMQLAQSTQLNARGMRKADEGILGGGLRAASRRNR